MVKEIQDQLRNFKPDDQQSLISGKQANQKNFKPSMRTQALVDKGNQNKVTPKNLKNLPMSSINDMLSAGLTGTNDNSKQDKKPNKRADTNKDAQNEKEEEKNE